MSNKSNKTITVQDKWKISKYLTNPIEKPQLNSTSKKDEENLVRDLYSEIETLHNDVDMLTDELNEQDLIIKGKSIMLDIYLFTKC